MRASGNDHCSSRHLSGAERIVSDDNLGLSVHKMLERSQFKQPNIIQITAERVPNGQCHHVPCLPVHTVHASSIEEAAEYAKAVLVEAGIDPDVAQAGCDALKTGLGRGGSAMRGASVWDSLTGERYEPDWERGVRTSRFDYSEEGAIAIDSALAAFGLTHFRIREALAVATKTLWSGVTAELCWSDEPDYTTGYIATNHDGYVRLPGFKPAGAMGGRIFFIDSRSCDVSECIRRLEQEYVLIDPPFHIDEPISVAQGRAPK
jgi:6-carboxyhexanoate--CoA ligase